MIGDVHPSVSVGLEGSYQPLEIDPSHAGRFSWPRSPIPIRPDRRRASPIERLGMQRRFGQG